MTVLYFPATSRARHLVHLSDDRIILTVLCDTALLPTRMRLGGLVTFNYTRDCRGNRPLEYDPCLYKVKQVLNHRLTFTNMANGDWARLKLATSVWMCYRCS